MYFTLYGHMSTIIFPKIPKSNPKQFRFSIFSWEISYSLEELSIGKIALIGKLIRIQDIRLNEIRLAGTILGMIMDKDYFGVLYVFDGRT